MNSVNDIKIKLEIKSHEYKYIADIFCKHKKTIGELKINNGFKESLIKDINIIASILGKSEIGMIPVT
jgi:hypothetical protein